MGEIVGFVTRSSGGAFAGGTLFGVPPDSRNSFVAQRSDGAFLGGEFSSASEAQRALERSLGGALLHWKIEPNTTGLERYVGRSPGIAPNDIPLRGGLWFRADRGLVERGAPPGPPLLPIWGSFDGSRQNRATQSAANAIPRLDPASVNGRDGVRFDASPVDKFLQTTITAGLPAPFTAFAVGRYETDLFRDKNMVDTGNFFMGVDAAESWSCVLPAGVVVGPAATNGEVACLSVIVPAVGQARFYRNGVLLGTFPNAAGPGPDAWLVSSSVGAWSGSLAELVVSPVELTTTLHDQLVRGYFLPRYQIGS